MKVWKLTMKSHDFGNVLSWHSSKRKAVSARTFKGDEMGADCYGHELEQVDIPTDMDGLLNWLNVYFDNDNG